MPTELRRATPADYADLERIWRETYGPNVEAVTDRAPIDEHFVIGLVDGHPCFATAILHFDILVRGQELKGAGLSMVATAGECRTRGIGTGCLHHLHRLLEDEGFEIAVLYGFREPFYRRVGYESCGWRWKITVPVDRMPTFDDTFDVRRIDNSEPWLLDDCYQEFVLPLSGSCRRDQEQWKERMGERAPLIFAYGDPIEAYWWCHPEGFWTDLEFGEFAWRTPDGYRAAMSHMRSMAINKSTVSWCEPPDSPFLSLYADQGVTAVRHRPTMFRLFEPTGVFDRLTDRPLTFAVAGANGDPSEYPVNGGGDRIETDEPTLALLALGDPGPEVLINQGRVRGDAASLNRLQDALPRQQVVCMDFF